MRGFDPWGFLPILKDLVVLLLPAAAAIWAWFKTRHAHSWPFAQGSVLNTQVRRSTDSYPHPWVVDIAYTYVVNGECYSGFYRIRARSESRAEEKVAGWKGRMVVVRYSPGNPEVSTLLKTDQPGGQLGN
ncbi:MAG TPA: DUF3592 domain-containing protein [Candidatus Aquilonibacter sp.]|nr:DUF3592 domain-containing protein [Candidatus Aquilonibacter sp.]